MNSFMGKQADAMQRSGRQEIKRHVRQIDPRAVVEFASNPQCPTRRRHIEPEENAEPYIMDMAHVAQTLNHARSKMHTLGWSRLNAVHR